MAARARRRWPWLLAAAVLVVLAAWLMSFGEPEPIEHLPQVRLPTRMSEPEATRAANRRTWVAPVVDVDAGVLAPPPRRRDPVLAALPPQVHRVAMVAEVNGILNSELGPLLMDCVGGGELQGVIDEFRDAGFDPLTALDRIAVADDTLLLSGDWSKVDPTRLFGKALRTSQDYGPNAKIYELQLSDGGFDAVTATWKGQMMIVAQDRATLKATLDRLDGTGPTGPSPIDEGQAYGELYGIVQRDAFSDAFGKIEPRLGDTIRDAASSAMLHLDVSHDVGLVADVDSVDAQKGEELRRTLGAALSVARVKAQASGDAEGAALLDLARVRAAKGNRFRVEAGLPNELAVKGLKECAEKRRESSRRRAERRLDGGAPAAAAAP